MQALLTVWNWCLAHPLVVWPIVTFLVTSLFGASEKYAATHPVFAKFLSLLETVGLDGPGLLKLLKGAMVPPVVAIVILIGASGVVTTETACTPQAGQAVATLIMPVGACIADVALDVSGAAPVDPLVIAKDCGGAVQDVYNVVSELLASHPDAGAKVGVSAAQFDRLLQIKALAEMQGARK
jgi:hypothetical protein